MSEEVDWSNKEGLEPGELILKETYKGIVIGAEVCPWIGDDCLNDFYPGTDAGTLRNFTLNGDTFSDPNKAIEFFKEYIDKLEKNIPVNEKEVALLIDEFCMVEIEDEYVEAVVHAGLLKIVLTNYFDFLRKSKPQLS